MTLLPRWHRTLDYEPGCVNSSNCLNYGRSIASEQTKLVVQEDALQPHVHYKC